MTETAQKKLPQTFNDIEHTLLKVFNRVAIMYNLRQDFGEEACQKYISQFSSTEMQQLSLMIAAIQAKGLDAVRKEVTKDLVLPNEEDLVMDEGIGNG